MSDIQAIRERHEKDKKFFAEEMQLPWEQDDCILALNDIATLLSALSAAEARAEAAEQEREILRSQAYQVIGSLLHTGDRDLHVDFSSDAGQAALDYFSGETVDEDFLPWPGTRTLKGVKG